MSSSRWLERNPHSKSRCCNADRPDRRNCCVRSIPGIPGLAGASCSVLPPVHDYGFGVIAPIPEIVVRAIVAAPFNRIFPLPVMLHVIVPARIGSGAVQSAVPTDSKRSIVLIEMEWWVDSCYACTFLPWPFVLWAGAHTLLEDNPA